MNTTIFSGVSEIYAKYRPNYPLELFEYLKEVGIDNNSIVSDIGSGTGILTQGLAECCKIVYAIEPNDDMRNAAEQLYKNYNNILSICGTAEKTTLKSQSVNYITAAQSFHWFDQTLFKKECRRILIPNGKVVLIWNCRNGESELVQTIDFINKKYCPKFTGSTNGMRGAVNPNDYSDFFNGEYITNTFRNDIFFNEERFIGLHCSSSYRLTENDINFKNYITALKDIFIKNSHNGILVMPNLTKVYIGSV